LDYTVVKLFIESGQSKTSKVVKIASNFPYVIGRLSPDLSINDANLSRRHCQLTVEMGGLYIEDLGSSNGVEVNGTFVKRSRLLINDQIRVGRTRMKVLEITLATKKVRKGGGNF
jgi:pSer/pThr/pTyr-binding forkhead associated (FHA) protein